MSTQPDNSEAKTYDDLTDRQKRFVDFYIKYWNGAKAARLAGYSKDNARIIAAQNLTNLNIRAIINARAALFVADEGEISTRLTTFARGSLKSFLDTDGNLSIDPNSKAVDLIKKIKVTKTITRKDDFVTERTTTELEIEDRQAALDKLARMRGLYKGENKQEETNPFAELTAEQLLEELAKMGLKKIDDEKQNENLQLNLSKKS
jgi:phage terminase small subunit